MVSLNNYYFFRCYHCGEWYYTNKVIKTKKCWKCNHSFQFPKATKFSKQCSMQGAIAILKELKKRINNEDLSKYISSDISQLTKKF